MTLLTLILLAFGLVAVAVFIQGEIDRRQANREWWQRWNRTYRR